ncbi:MAG TPA: NAD-dependent epimerase/dehydratase family protein [Chloroflexota bacterium]|nr:NAD-dependent epimerase/dehydratase family protein [Chloroflexota bacterium]
MPVLVTGATGLLGSHVVDLLVERGEAVRALVRPGEDVQRLLCSNVEICRGDLGDASSLKAAVSSVDRVLHCAARTGPWGPAADYQVANVTGLRSLLDHARAAGVQRFVHVSSVTVHGNDVRGTADETAPFRVEPNPYSRSKVQGERIVRQMIEKEELPVTVVRPGLIYGPRDRSSFGRFATMIRRRTMVVIGTGHNHLPLVYVRDVAEGLLRASEVADAVGQTYLLVNDEPVTQHDYLAAIASELGVPPPAMHVPYHLALGLGTVAELLGHLQRREHPPALTRYGLQVLGGENRFLVDRARRELGFSPRIDLAEGVRRSVAWYRAACDGVEGA